jgi:hypothetical protein
MSSIPCSLGLHAVHCAKRGLHEPIRTCCEQQLAHAGLLLSGVCSKPHPAASHFWHFDFWRR